MTCIVALGFGELGLLAADTRAWMCDQDGAVVGTDDVGTSKLVAVRGGFYGLGGLYELSRAITERAKGGERLTPAVLEAEREVLKLTHPAIAENELGARLLHGTPLYHVGADAEGGIWVTELNTKRCEITTTRRPHGVVGGPYGSTAEDLAGLVSTWQAGLAALFDRPDTALRQLTRMVQITARLFAGVAERYGGLEGPCSDSVEFGLLFRSRDVRRQIQLPALPAADYHDMEPWQLQRFIEEAERVGV